MRTIVVFAALYLVLGNVLPAVSQEKPPVVAEPPRYVVGEFWKLALSDGEKRGIRVLAIEGDTVVMLTPLPRQALSAFEDC